MNINPAKVQVEAGIGASVRVWELCYSFVNEKEKDMHDPSRRKEFLLAVRCNVLFIWHE